MEQLISSPAVQFKGTGWYVTDYARKSGGTSSDSSNGEPGKKDEKAKGSKDEKPKAESKKPEKK